VPAPSAEDVTSVVVDTREEALEWFRQEESTVAAALRSMNDPRLLRYRMYLTHDWVSYYSIMGRWADEISAKRIGLDAALVLDDPTAIARNCSSLARALAQTGQVDQAEEQVDLMLGQLRRLPPAEQAATERSIGWVRGRQGRHTEALHHARRALALFRALGDRGSEARELNAVGWYLTLLGDHRQAIAMCEEALPMLREAGNRRSEAATWDSIGYARQRLGELDAAIADYHRSLRLYEEALDSYNQADVLDHIASVQLERGDDAEARESWTRAARLLSAIGDPRAEEMRVRAGALDEAH
jgi:tetratricopeptide (TPR) repeat protein